MLGCDENSEEETGIPVAGNKVPCWLPDVVRVVTVTEEAEPRERGVARVCPSERGVAVAAWVEEVVAAVVVVANGVGM